MWRPLFGLIFRKREATSVEKMKFLVGTMRVVVPKQNFELKSRE